ncbi:MAG: pyruvate ferredoxin oxidoreductase [Thermaerobacter sp.]|nr:pyruvate ferredoxin oxidoreductase [Thermaerobacter sp.]
MNRLPFHAPGQKLDAMTVITGAQGVAHAIRQIDPDVFPVYPITPQTPIIQTLSQFVADGLCHTHVLDVESEHSAMSAAIGAALAGVRTMTATASQGLALMVEVIYLAASMRAPIVTAVGNRALSGPINIHGDHSDAMLARDSGAVQLFVENAEEAYHFTIIATRVAEDPRVLLPVMVGLDGFTITHSAEPVALLPDERVRAFVGPYSYPYPLLGPEVGTYGPFAMPDSYFECKRQQIAALENGLEVFEQVSAAFADLAGRHYLAVEPYRLAGAQAALVMMGSHCGTAKDVVDGLRSQGLPVGLLQIRLYRPFPREMVGRLLADIPQVAVLDKASSPGTLPPLFLDVAASVSHPRQLVSVIYGLGGRDVPAADLAGLYHGLLEQRLPQATPWYLKGRPAWDEEDEPWPT